MNGIYSSRQIAAATYERIDLRVLTGDDESETWATMRAKLATEQGKQLYSRRKVIVEPVFGHIKEPRGFRRFSLRGVTKVRAEWTLVCLCHNLIKLLVAQPDLAAA